MGRPPSRSVPTWAEGACFQDQLEGRPRVAWPPSSTPLSLGATGILGQCVGHRSGSGGDPTRVHLGTPTRAVGPEGAWAVCTGSSRTGVGGVTWHICFQPSIWHSPSWTSGCLGCTVPVPGHQPPFLISAREAIQASFVCSGTWLQNTGQQWVRPAGLWGRLSRHGLGHSLGRAVLRELCRDLRPWPRGAQHPGLLLGASAEALESILTQNLHVCGLSPLPPPARVHRDVGASGRGMILWSVLQATDPRPVLGVDGTLGTRRLFFPLAWTVGRRG